MEASPTPPTPGQGPTLLGYARVSRTEQNPESQDDALRRAGCSRIWTDFASGALDARPELTKLLDYARPGDTIVVRSLDRLGRSLRNLIVLMQDLEQRKINLRSLTESIDTSTPVGELIFHFIGAIAQFERSLIRERSLAGLAAARARGRVGGRPPVLPPTKLAVAQQMYDSKEHTLAVIARTLGVSRQTLYRHLAPLSTEYLNVALSMRAAGHQLPEIAKAVGISKARLHKLLRDTPAPAKASA